MLSCWGIPISFPLLHFMTILLPALIFLITNPSKADYPLVGLECSHTYFEANSSTYEDSINTLLASLASSNTTVISNGYGYIATSITGSDDADIETIYGMFLCQGDIIATGSDSCQGCVAKAKSDMPVQCPNDKIVTIWYDECIVRYSNVSFINYVDDNKFEFLKNNGDIGALTDKVNSKEFVDLVGETLTNLAEELVSGNKSQDEKGRARKYYGTKEAVFDSYITLYTMAQCTPDLDTVKCTMCLSLARSKILELCKGSIGCRTLNPSCYTRYEKYPFYRDMNSPPPAHPPSLPPPPPDFISHPPTGNNKKIQSPAITIALVILVLLLVALVAALMYVQCRTRMNDNVRKVELQERTRNALTFDSDFKSESLQFGLAMLEDATNNFSIHNKLGEGGFGSVYKGTLPNGQEIAVKRLSNHSYMGIEQFKAEVEFIAKLQHRNLVRLLGYCTAEGEKLIVYEFVPRKSLDLILFDCEMKQQLNWSTRYKIIQGIARGILYLHEDSRFKIIHRDLKTSNVLLDANMNPKVSDFGLARNLGVDQTNTITSKAAGTPGYMAPEYLEYGELSTKSDVYSFGVLVLEIISGNKVSNRQPSIGQNLLIHAWKLYDKSTPLEFVDPSLGDSFSSNEFLRCMHLGLLCVQSDSQDRPSMISIVSYLNSNITLPAPQQPATIDSSKKGSSSGTRELVSDRSTKTTSSSKTIEKL